MPCTSLTPHSCRFSNMLQSSVIERNVVATVSAKATPFASDILISQTDAPARMTMYVPNFEMNFLRISLDLKNLHFLLCVRHFHKSYSVYGVCGYVHFHHLAVCARYRVSVSSAIRNANAMYNCKCTPSAEETLVTPALAITFTGKCSVTDFNVFIEKNVFMMFTRFPRPARPSHGCCSVRHTDRCFPVLFA